MRNGDSIRFRDVIVPAFPGTLLLSQWIPTKAILGKAATNHIPAFACTCRPVSSGCELQILVLEKRMYKSSPHQPRTHGEKTMIAFEFETRSECKALQMYYGKADQKIQPELTSGFCC